MHEMSLCEGILAVVEEQSARQGFSVVNAVHLEIGQFATVEESALRFCFDAVRANTVAASAQLIIETVAASTWCFACGKAVQVTHRYDPCPDCGGHQLQSEGGEELRIKELEVE